MLNVPDPTQSVVSGVQRGIELAALMDERKLRQAKIEKQKRLENAISSLGDNPTVEQIGAIMRNNPDISGEFTTLYNALSESEQQERLGQAQRSYAATLQGRPDIAAQILNEAAVAYENAGRANDAKAMRDQAALVEADPKFSKTISGLFLASAMGPEKFAQSFSNFESARVAEEGYRALTAEEVAAKGLPPGNYQVALGGASKGKISPIGGGGVNVTVGGAPAETFTPKELKSFQDAVVSSRFQLENIRRAREALPNAIVGTGAEARFELARLAQLVSPGNKDVDKALSSTRALVQSSAEAALGSRFMITGDGQGPATEGEQLLLNKARAGDISFTEPEWQELLNILDRVMRYEEQQGLMDLQAAADAGSEPAKVRLKRLGMPTPAPAAGGGARGATPTNVEVDY